MPRTQKGRGIVHIRALPRKLRRNLILTAIRRAGGEIVGYPPATSLERRGLSEMKKIIFAGVLALAAITISSGTSGAFAGDRTGAIAAQPQEAAAVDIARVKRVLMLTPEQEAYWPPVEAALRALARRQAAAEPTGLVRRISHRVVSVVLDGAAIRHLAIAARPLIAALRDDQKQMALGLAQEMGLGPVLAALN
jgi:hypothetical protein